MQISKKKKKIIYSFILAICVFCVGYFSFRHIQREQRSKAFKNTVLNVNKPLNEKLGELVWLWGDKYNNINQQDAKRQIDYCKQIGVKYVKIPLYLNYLVSKNGKIKNDDFDKVLNYAKKKGMVPIVRMWFTKGGGYNSKSFLSTGEKMAGAVINRFGAQNIIWESTNEPNQLVSWFSQDTSTNFDWAKFDEYVGTKLKRRNKNAVYIVGDLSGTTSEAVPFLKTALMHGYYKNADAVSNHPYQKQTNELNGQPEDGLNNNKASYFNQVFAEYHRKKLPLVTTEIGYSTKKTWAGKWSARDQANYVARQVFILDMQKQPLIVLFSLSDKQSAENDSGWGLLRGDAYSSQVYKASGILLKNLLSQLKGYAFEQRIRTQKGTKSSFTLLYYNKKLKKYKVVYWATTPDQLLKAKILSHRYEMYATATPQILNIN